MGQHIEQHITLLFRDGGPYHIKTCPLIFSTNQRTGFFMIGISVNERVKYDKLGRYAMQMLFYDFPAFNSFSANPTKWSNTLKQFVCNLPTNRLSVFDHFVKLALKGLNNTSLK